MLKYMLFAVVVVAATLPWIAMATATGEPWFCHGLDCPGYTVLSQANGYEVRRYNESQWARTLVKGVDYDDAVQKGFKRLFNYISGDNVDNEKIEMTAPVQVRIDAGQGPFCDSNFTVSFMVPFANQPNPPKPTEKDIYIAVDKAHIAYVTSFPGFAKQNDVLDAAVNLTQALQRDNVSFNSSHFYFAGYDSPFRIVNRHNEVWFWKL